MRIVSNPYLQSSYTVSKMEEIKEVSTKILILGP